MKRGARFPACLQRSGLPRGQANHERELMGGKVPDRAEGVNENFSAVHLQKRIARRSGGRFHPSRMSRVVRTVVSVVVTFAAAVAGYFLMGKVFDQMHAPPDRKNWSVRKVAGLVVDAPGEFKSATIDFGAVRDVMDSTEAHAFKMQSFEVNIVRSVYKEGIDLNLDGAVNGAVGGIAGLDGVKNVQQTVKEEPVSGKPARRLSLTAERWRKTLRLEAVIIADGRTYYQVQVIFEGRDPHGAEDAERLLNSVKLAP
jgi:hypothetical protein